MIKKEQRQREESDKKIELDLNYIRKELVSEYDLVFKQLRDQQAAATKEMRTKIQQLEEKCNEDPMPQDRIDMLKYEIKEEMRQEMALQKQKTLLPTEPDGGLTSRSGISEAVLEELNTQIESIKKIFTDKLEKVELSCHSNSRLLEAKIKKSFKEKLEKITK